MAECESLLGMSQDSQPHDNSSWLSTSTEGGGDYAEFYSGAQFVTGLIIYPIICVVGLSGNVLTLFVLSQPKMLTSTNIFLAALALADIIKLINDCLYVIVNILMRTAPIAANRMMAFMYPFSHYIFNQSVCVASWLTVSVAIERYIAVCHATRAKVVCTINRARIISVSVFISMSLVTIPSYLRYTRQKECQLQPVPHQDDHSEQKGLIMRNQTMYTITLSSLGQNESFMTGYTWIQNLLRCLVPLFVLLVLNACIIQALRRQRIPGKKMSQRNRITLMLIIVIVVFIICIFPDAIMSTFFNRFGYVEENNLIRGVREITDTLLSINSAVNFIIYCVCSKGFRNVACEMLFHSSSSTTAGSSKKFRLSTKCSAKALSKPHLATARQHSSQLCSKTPADNEEGGAQEHQVSAVYTAEGHEETYL